VLWFIASTVGYFLSLIRLVRGQPRGKARFSIDDIEARAKLLANNETAQFVDTFHRQALGEIVGSFLESNEIKEFVIALPFAATLERKLRIESHFASTRPGPLPDPVVFIVGLPRTGSTLLHQLCALDPAARALRSWELKMPLPMSNAPQEVAARKQKIQNTLDFFYRLAPRIKQVHFVNADDPDECVQGFMDCVLPDMYCWGAIDADRAFEWFVNTDMSPMLRNYEKLLRVVVAEDEAAGDHTHVMLKSPHHTWMLPALAKTFPRAKFVWIHRTPASSVGSTCSMNEAILDVTCSRFVHPHVLGKRTLDRLAMCVEKGMVDRAALVAERGTTFVDVQYAHLKADPVGCVAQMYRDLGLGDLSGEFVDRIESLVREHEKAPWKGHEYSLEHFGLTEDEIQVRFDKYVGTFLEPRAPAGQRRGRRKKKKAR
jgi:hypothetical protein